MKCFCKFRGKNIIFENFGRPTIHILKILGKFSGNFLILENFGVAMPSSTHSSKWFCPYLDLNLPYPNHILTQPKIKQEHKSVHLKTKQQHITSVYVCVCVRERERERYDLIIMNLISFIFSISLSQYLRILE